VVLEIFPNKVEKNQKNNAQQPHHISDKNEYSADLVNDFNVF
jgi:hypothetical protein